MCQVVPSCAWQQPTGSCPACPTACRRVLHVHGAFRDMFVIFVLPSLCVSEVWGTFRAFETCSASCAVEKLKVLECHSGPRGSAAACQGLSLTSRSSLVYHLWGFELSQKRYRDYCRISQPRMLISCFSCVVRLPALVAAAVDGAGWLHICECFDTVTAGPHIMPCLLL